MIVRKSILLSMCFLLALLSAGDMEIRGRILPYIGICGGTLGKISLREHHGQHLVEGFFEAVHCSVWS